MLESREEPRNINDILTDTQLFAIHMMDNQNHEFNAIIHFLSIGYALEGMSTNQKKHLVVKATNNTLIAGHMYKLCANEILRRSVFYYE